MMRIKEILLLSILCSASVLTSSPVRSTSGKTNIDFLEFGEEVPYDSKVEYLESTGEQYIDTGIYADQYVEADIIGCNTRLSGASYGFGSRVAWANNQFAIYNGSDNSYRYVFLYGSVSNPGAAKSTISSTNGVFHLFHIANRCSIDDVVIGEWHWGSITPFKTPSTLYVFASYTGNKITTGEWKIRQVIIYKESDVILDMVSVRFTNEFGLQEGAMYDRISGGIFRNQGSGDFIIGPDIR